MRYLLLIISLTGGLLSFNSFASVSASDKPTPQQCSVRPELKDTTMTHTWQAGAFYYAYYQGCEYVESHSSSSEMCITIAPDGFYCNWKPTGKVEPSDGTPDTKPDNPDVKPPSPDVKPPEPEKPDSPAGSHISQTLSSISRMSPDSLYTSFIISYDYSATPEDNQKVAQAFLSKLSNVTPPSYYAVDHIKSMMDDWQKSYSYMRPSDAGPYLLWHASKFVDGEHRYLGSVVLPVDTCTHDVTDGSVGDDGRPVYHPETSHNCADKRTDIDINDPVYASLNDYKNGVTRCMRNPDDASCHSSDDSSGGSGDTSSGSPVLPGSSSGSSTDECTPFGDGCYTSTGVCPSGMHAAPGSSYCLPDSGTGDKPDSCPPGSHHEPGTLEGSCTTDFNPNPGGGGGSGSGNTDSNDNGDVVAAINAFHADNNKNHRELMDDMNKKPADPDYTGMEGEFSSMVGGAMSGITDSVKSAWDAGKAAFGEGLSGIDSMLPDIKTSFDLPPGFEAASTGRCIPVVLDFDIKLVGIPDYHFHAVGTQVCLLYDKYIRPVLNFCMVILSFFVIHRLLIRSAEFLTDGRH